MFEPRGDQAAGLRHLFEAPPPLALLPLACARGDAFDRAGAAALARSLARAGRRPIIVDLLDEAEEGDAGHDAFDGVASVAAQHALAQGSGGGDLAEFALGLQRRALRGGLACDLLVVVAEPLRLADLSADLSDRMMVLSQTDSASLARVYAQIKAIGLAHGLSRHVVAFRGARSREIALAAHRRLASTAARFLDVTVEFGGLIVSPTRDRVAWDRLAVDAIRWVHPIAGRELAGRH